mmetsp:Transcript_11208/g.14140  ORF Transcript_11208/g.14140 Transcript_11208/m.14140 type:complete len:267 (-) Transcript_11208:459-1259(-)
MNDIKTRPTECKIATVLGSFATQTRAGHHGYPSTFPKTNSSVWLVLVQISVVELYFSFLFFCDLLLRVLVPASQYFKALVRVFLSLLNFCRFGMARDTNPETSAANLDMILQSFTASLQSTRSALLSPSKQPTSIIASPHRYEMFSKGSSSSFSSSLSIIVSSSSSSSSPFSTTSKPPYFSNTDNAICLALPAAPGLCKLSADRKSSSTSSKLPFLAIKIADIKTSRMALARFVGMNFNELIFFFHANCIFSAFSKAFCSSLISFC